jgi:hypothetical protein
MNDPIVTEVREIREQIARECEFDMHKLFELQKRSCDQWKGKKVTSEELAAWQKTQSEPAKVAESKAEYVTKRKSR